MRAEDYIAECLLHTVSALINADKMEGVERLAARLYVKKSPPWAFYAVFSSLMRSVKTCYQMRMASWIFREFCPRSIKGEMLERLLFIELSMTTSFKSPTMTTSCLRRIDLIRRNGRISEDFLKI
jgi:hypothetical protein